MARDRWHGDNCYTAAGARAASIIPREALVPLDVVHHGRLALDGSIAAGCGRGRRAVATGEGRRAAGARETHPEPATSPSKPGARRCPEPADVNSEAGVRRSPEPGAWSLTARPGARSPEPGRDPTARPGAWSLSG